MDPGRQDYDRIQDPAMLIPRTEPVFLLRAQDTCAAATVDFWADMAENSGAHPDIVRLAREQAIRMANWRKHKTPDLLLTPEFSGEGGSTVNDEERTPQEEAPSTEPAEGEGTPPAETPADDPAETVEEPAPETGSETPEADKPEGGP